MTSPATTNSSAIRVYWGRSDSPSARMKAILELLAIEVNELRDSGIKVTPVVDPDYATVAQTVKTGYLIKVESTTPDLTLAPTAIMDRFNVALRKTGFFKDVQVSQHPGYKGYFSFHQAPAPEVKVEQHFDPVRRNWLVAAIFGANAAS